MNVQASLSARKDGESSFHRSGSPVKLVQACVCVGSTLQRRIHRRGVTNHWTEVDWTGLAKTSEIS